MITLELLGQSYARELARLLGAPLSVVQKGLASLERDGIIAGRYFGRTRLFEINPAYFAAEQLRGLIARLTAADPELKTRVAALRRRPRRTGKRL